MGLTGNPYTQSRLSGMQLTNSVLGQDIPILYGTNRLSSNLLGTEILIRRKQNKNSGAVAYLKAGLSISTPPA